MPIGPAFPPIDPPLGPEMRFLPAEDLNSDSGHDLLLAEPSGTAVLIDMLTEPAACQRERPGAQCETQVEFLAPAGAEQFAVGDGNDDRIDDLWFLDEEQTLHGAFWLAALGERRQVPVMSLPGLGPIALGDADGDRAPELTLALPGRAWRWNGRAHPNDPLTLWSPDEGTSEVVRSNVLPHFAVVELDGDPTTNEIVLFTHENVDTRLKVVQFTNGAGRAVILGRYRLEIEKVPVDDLQMCGTDAWIAVQGRAWRIDVAVPEKPELQGFPLGNQVTRVDCRTVDGVRYGAYLERDEVTAFSYDDGSSTVFPVPGAFDFVLAGGSGGLRVDTCASADCSLARWDFGGPDGLVTVQSDASGTRFDGEELVAHHGLLTVADINQDGSDDLLGVDPDTGLVFVHWSTGASIAPVTLWHTVRPIAGAIQVGDADDDGNLDLWTIDVDGELEWLAADR